MKTDGQIRNTLPRELIDRLEDAMAEIKFGSATVQWAERGSFISLEVVEKLRFDNPEKDISSTYNRG
jgi:hypothetical protein